MLARKQHMGSCSLPCGISPTCECQYAYRLTLQGCTRLEQLPIRTPQGEGAQARSTCVQVRINAMPREPQGKQQRNISSNTRSSVVGWVSCQANRLLLSFVSTDEVLPSCKWRTKATVSSSLLRRLHVYDCVQDSSGWPLLHTAQVCKRRNHPTYHQRYRCVPQLQYGTSSHMLAPVITHAQKQVVSQQFNRQMQQLEVFSRTLTSYPLLLHYGSTCTAARV
jgi:hypothetical protein